MHVYTKCKFCYSEIPPSRITDAFCDKECKTKHEVWGNVYLWRQNKPKPKKQSRKTNQKRAKSQPKPLQAVFSVKVKEINPITKRKHSVDRLVAPVIMKDGSTVLNYVMCFDPSDFAPPILTGGAITKKGD